MIIELEINGARLIVSGENLTVSVSQDQGIRHGIASPVVRRRACPTSGEIRALRKSLGLRQKPFSIMLGVSQGSVSRWENGIETPNGSSAILLADMLAEQAA